MYISTRIGGWWVRESFWGDLVVGGSEWFLGVCDPLPVPRHWLSEFKRASLCDAQFQLGPRCAFVQNITDTDIHFGVGNLQFAFSPPIPPLQVGVCVLFKRCVFLCLYIDTHLLRTFFRVRREKEREPLTARPGGHCCNATVFFFCCCRHVVLVVVVILERYTCLAQHVWDARCSSCCICYSWAFALRTRVDFQLHLYPRPNDRLLVRQMSCLCGL